MKIIGVDVYTVDPAKGSTPNSVEYPDIWTFVRVRTDEGITAGASAPTFPATAA